MKTKKNLFCGMGGMDLVSVIIGTVSFLKKYEQKIFSGQTDPTTTWCMTFPLLQNIFNYVVFEVASIKKFISHKKWDKVVKV